MAAPAPTAIERAPIARRLLAEYLGTTLLVAIVVGSGIAASALSPDDVGLQLLESSFATALGLAVLIAGFASVSGAHFNPVVTAADWASGRRSGGFPLRDVVPYVGAQVLGAVSGALLANVMFDVPAGIATTERVTTGSLVAEAVATAGLTITIFGLVRTGRASLVPPAVGAYIGAAYWFTSSTSFANPAVTIGRVFSDTFAGIAPSSVLPFIVAQILGAAAGAILVLALFPVARRAPSAEEPAEPRWRNHRLSSILQT